MLLSAWRACECPTSRLISPSCSPFRTTEGGHTHCVQSLLRRRADPNADDAEGCTPLLAALAGGHRRAAEALLAAGAQPGGRTGEGCWPGGCIAQRSRIGTCTSHFCICSPAACIPDASSCPPPPPPDLQGAAPPSTGPPTTASPRRCTCCWKGGLQGTSMPRIPKREGAGRWGYAPQTLVATWLLSQPSPV